MSQSQGKSCIFFYSNFCKHSKAILLKLSKYENIERDIHFLCVDKRVQRDNKIFIILENGQEILLPETITDVPSLFLLNNNFKVIKGDDICRYIEPKRLEEEKIATMQNMEPLAFSMSSGGVGNYISSDSYSYLDQSSDELNTGGNGGMRQIGQYSTPDGIFQIDTPQVEENMSEPKIREEDMAQFEKERNLNTTILEQGQGERRF